MTFWCHLAWKWVNKKEQRYVSKPKSKSLQNMIFYNWLFFLRPTSKHKRSFADTDTASKVMFSSRISLINVNKSGGTCRYLYLKTLVHGSWNCIHVWRSFFLFRFLHIVNCKSVMWEPFSLVSEPFSVVWFRRQNLKTRRVKVPPT